MAYAQTNIQLYNQLLDLAYDELSLVRTRRARGLGWPVPAPLELKGDPPALFPKLGRQARQEFPRRLAPDPTMALRRAGA